LTLKFTLLPVGGGGSGGGPGPGAQQPLVPMTFQGGAGFGYTLVNLSLHFQPNGQTYAVSGAITVNQANPVGTALLRVAGTYNPASVPAQLTVTGVPPGGGGTPLLTCTQTGTNRLDCRLSGLPSLGINSLGIIASLSSGTATRIWNTYNTAGVLNGPSGPTPFYLGGYTTITEVDVYMYNNGLGATPGWIGLQSQYGNFYGWMPAHANGPSWQINPDLPLPADWYWIWVSDPSAWSFNSASKGYGFAQVWGF
jgi:hypothetical protein